MATVPVYGPQEVQARPANAPAIQGDASPAAFGAVQGQALQGVGQNLDTLGGITSRIAGSMAIDDAKRTATDADTQWRQAKLDLTFGQNGFYSQKGQGAIDAQGPTTDALAQKRQAIEDSITDPRAKQMFHQVSMGSLIGEQEGMARFVLGQRAQADQNSSNARIDAASQDAASKYNDTSVLDSSLAVARGEMGVQAQQQGWTPEVAADQTLKRTGSIISTVVQQRAIDDPVGASAMLTQYGSQMDAPTRIRLQEYLKPRMIARQAQAGIDGLMAAATGVPASTGTFADNIRVESGGKQFGPDGTPLTSSAGAVGVAQVLPETGKETAAAHGIAWDQSKFENDPAYNAKLGSLYHADLMTKYGGNKMLADAAYNAGPGKVDGWLTTIGNPNNGEISNQQFAKSIPIQETRDYVQKTGSAMPSASQMNGFHYPDFAALSQKVLDQTEGQPELRAAMLAKLGAAKAQLDAVQATKRSTITKSWQDGLAALEAGKSDVTLPADADIDAVFPPPVAADMKEKKQVAQTAGQIISSVAYAAPQDVAAARAQLDSPGGLSGVLPTHGPKKPQLIPTGDATAPAAPEAETDDHYRMRKAVLQTFDQAVLKRQAALVGPNADPVAYVANEPTVAAAIASGDKVAAAQASLAVQAHLGVPADQQRVLSSLDAQNKAHILASTDPEKGDAGAALAGLQKTYGSLWPQVYGDLVHAGMPATFQTLSNIKSPLGRSDFQRAVQAQARLGTKFDDSISPANKTAIESEIEQSLTPFAGTLASSAGGMQLFNSVTMPSVKALATYYASPTSGLGLDGTSAADRAVKTIIGDQYDISGPLRTPKDQMSQVLNAGDTLLAGIKQEDLTKDISPTMARAGQWMTTPDDKGVTLFVRTPSGGYRQAQRADGSPIGFTFDHLPTAPLGPTARGAGSAVQQGYDMRGQNVPVDGQ